MWKKVKLANVFDKKLAGIERENKWVWDVQAALFLDPCIPVTLQPLEAQLPLLCKDQSVVSRKLPSGLIEIWSQPLISSSCLGCDILIDGRPRQT